MERSQIINRIKSLIRHVAPDAEVILFGSVARGDDRPDSDIDLLIIVDREVLTLQEKWAITDPLFDLGAEELVYISPKIYTRREWYGRPFRTPFMINIMNEGVRL